MLTDSANSVANAGRSPRPAVENSGAGVGSRERLTLRYPSQGGQWWREILTGATREPDGAGARSALPRERGRGTLGPGGPRAACSVRPRPVVLPGTVILEARMKVTAKGQVTIPLAVREQLGLIPNTEVEFVIEGGRAVLQKFRRSQRRGAKVVAHLRGRGTVQMTTEEILSLTRGE